jgi:hypothetical protein
VSVLLAYKQVNGDLLVPHQFEVLRGDVRQGGDGGGWRAYKQAGRMPERKQWLGSNAFAWDDTESR